jgi:transcriptional regulator with XRE-family HTH domain
LNVKKQQQKRSKNSPGVGSRYVANPLVVAFATRLKEWRQGKGLTLKIMSADTGLSMAIVCEWEHGHRFPSVDHLLAVSKYTGIPAHDLIRPVKGAAAKKGRTR